MKTYITLIVLIVFVLCTGCDQTEPVVEQTMPTYLISDVYDIDNRLVAHYEYNNDGYPVSVTVKWKDIETEKPLTMKIKYLKRA